MRKPTKREDRVITLVKKLGPDIFRVVAPMTDKEVKNFFDSLWEGLKEKRDYEASTDDPQPICLKCQQTVEIEFNVLCGCGKNQATFNKSDPLD